LRRPRLRDKLAVLPREGAVTTVDTLDRTSAPARTERYASEREARIELAACYRLIAHFGMDDLAYTHISLRVPGTDNHFLINPFGMLFQEVTASTLVKVDHEGEIVGPSDYPINRAGFVIHSAIHMAHGHAECVLHTHTRAGVAISCLEDGLIPLNQWSLMFKDRVGYHDFEGIALDLDERQRLLRDLGGNFVLVLRNHGLLTTGRSVAEAFRRMYYLEQSCRVQLDVMATGAKIYRPTPEVSDKTAEQYRKIADRHETGAPVIEWPGLLRLLDARDPSYRN
jgi:ribulose-5-phosphate 4-epimerase/fuculose-1-phosphate aldolase